MKQLRVYNMIKLHKEASVVTLSCVREILWILGYSAVSDGMKLHVYEGEQKYSLYVKESKRADYKLITKLTVDEGLFSYVLQSSGSLHRCSESWDELVDYCDLLSVIVHKLLPDAEVNVEHYHGRGRQTRAFIDAYHEVLKDDERVIISTEATKLV